MRRVAVQGAIWFVLLNHGGKGIFFGPLAWLAVLIGTRYPGVAAGLLVIPVALVFQGWAPILMNGASASDVLIVGALVMPAVFSIAIFIRASLRGLITATAK